MPVDNEPTFNLKVVVQETGLKPDTLRAWERRYGLPQPQRTEGGHRLYSQRDIDTLKWLVARQKEGMNISRAVELWGLLQEEGQDPLQSSISPGPDSPAVLPAPGGAALDNLRQEWFGACMAFNEAGAEQILNQAFALYQVETVCLELLFKGLAQIGSGWYEGGITVQQEHFASELAVRRIEALIMGSPAPHRPSRILLACPPAEEHTFSPLLLTLFLRRRGWDVLYLGANVPADRLKATIETVKPDLAILVALQLTTAAGLLQLADVLTFTQTPLAYGGLIFNRVPALRRRIPGYFLGEKFEEAVPNLERWLTAPHSPKPVPAAEPVAPVYRQALEHFRRQQSMVEVEVWRSLHHAGFLADHLHQNTRYLAQSIEAALALGNLDFLNEDISWVETLLCHRSIPPELLNQHLDAYRQVAAAQLDASAQVVVDWLTNMVTSLTQNPE
jgi:DNA-binding transcriptional MerR regulator